MPSADSAHPASPFRRLRAVPALLATGCLALAGGIFMLWRDQRQIQEFGWFAYAPLSDTVFLPQPTGMYLGGIVALAAGAALVFLALGMVLERRLVARRRAG